MRMPAGAFLLACAALLVPTSSFAAWPHDPNSAPEVAPTGFYQQYPSADTDGAGGLLVAWEDQRAGSFNVEIYAQHLVAGGNVAPGWPASGLAVCTASGSQNFPGLVTDGAGGCWIAWEDSRVSSSDRDIYLQHILANGTIGPGFAANGLRLNTSVGKDEFNVRLAADGAGGVYVSWTLVFNAVAPQDYDIYATHVTAAGTVQFVLPLDSAGNVQSNASLVCDGNGNGIVAYLNNDNGSGSIGPYQIRSFRFGPTGTHLTATTTISSPAPAAGNAPVLVTDAAGGAFLVYNFVTGTGAQYFVTRLSALEAVLWPPTPLASVASTVSMNFLAVCPDGAGGLMAGWSDNRTVPNWSAFLERILPTGFRPAGWPATGLPVASSANGPVMRAIASDGTGGAVTTWIDNRNSGGEYYATRVTGAAAFAAGWNATGNPLSTAGSPAGGAPALLPDGSGGVVAAFSFARTGFPQILSLNLDAFGQPGDNRPVLGKPKDVGFDQGGKVRLAWNASWLDQPASLGIAAYWVWRQTPAAAAQAAVRSGAGRWEASSSAPAAAVPAAGTRWFRPAGAAGALYAWEFLTALGTNGSAQYSYVAATASDSMTGHNPYTVFMVEARGGWPGTFWQSAPDSGYSVDNLPPLPPAPFAGTYLAGTASLHWGPNLEADLAGYRVYRGSTTAFAPSAGNLIASPGDTSWVDAAGQPWVYKLSAVDSHGNESAFVTLAPGGVLDVAHGPALLLALSAPVPNPARGSASITYTLSRSGAVRLSLFDASGRHVRELAHGVQDAGEHRVQLELRTGSRGALPAGLYWVRLEAEGRALARRVLTLP